MDFEKQYYEADCFWKDGMVNDEFNKNRIVKTADLIPSSVTTLADIGCGNGVFLEYLNDSKPHLDLIGVDRSETALTFVKTNKQVGDIESLPFEDNSFDCVTCLEVIEHLPVMVYKKALEELCRISKRYVIVSVPYNEISEEGYTKCPKCLTIFNSDLHLRSFQKKDMEELLLQNGYKCLIHQTLGEIQKLLGQHKFNRLFKSKSLYRWNSPICPLCGFSGKNNGEIEDSDSKLKDGKPNRRIINYINHLFDRFWPKVKKDYWILALYEKQNIT